MTNPSLQNLDLMGFIPWNCGKCPYCHGNGTNFTALGDYTSPMLSLPNLRRKRMRCGGIANGGFGHGCYEKSALEEIFDPTTMQQILDNAAKFFQPTPAPTAPTQSIPSNYQEITNAKRDEIFRSIFN